MDKNRFRIKISAAVILVALAIPGTAIGGANPTNLITNGNFVTPCGAAPIALHNSISLVDITRP